MDAEESKDIWRIQSDHVQVTYDLPYRISGAISYPVLAANGSSLIIHGHHHGIRVTWRGGSPFKSTARSSARNGSSQDNSVMVIDDDEDDVQPQHSTNSATFIEDPTEFDPSRPFDDVLISHEVSLNSPVVQMSCVGSLPRDAATTQSPRIPSIFHSHAVLAVACADNSVRLIAFSLLPNEQRIMDVSTLFLVSAGSVHRSPAVHLTTTFTSADSLSQSTSEDEGNPDRPISRETQLWKLIVASSSSRPLPVLASSELLLHGSKIDTAAQAENHIHRLKAALCALHFNISRFPSPRHTWLLAADVTGTVHIGDYIARHKTSGPSRHVIHNLTWQSNLYVPFSDSQLFGNHTSAAHRLRILDAQWAMHGKCVVILLEDSSWGLWDVDSAGPYSERSLAGSIPGSAATRFALRGRLRTSASYEDTSNALPQQQEGSRPDRKLAPMTPNTRKSKQTNLFSGPLHTAVKPTSIVRGGIAATETSLLVHFDSQVYYEEDLMNYWRRTASSGPGAEGPSTFFGPSLQLVEDLSTGGEAITHLSVLATSSLTPQSGDIFLSAEHRIVLLSSIRNDFSIPTASSTLGPSRPSDAQSISTNLIDSNLLARNELDLDGIDRMLDSMEDSTALSRLSNGTDMPALFGGSRPSRRVEFAAR